MTPSEFVLSGESVMVINTKDPNKPVVDGPVANTTDKGVRAKELLPYPQMKETPRGHYRYYKRPSEYIEPTVNTVYDDPMFVQLADDQPSPGRSARCIVDNLSIKNFYENANIDELPSLEDKRSAFSQKP